MIVCVVLVEELQKAALERYQVIKVSVIILLVAELFQLFFPFAERSTGDFSIWFGRFHSVFMETQRK